MKENAVGYFLSLCSQLAGLNIEQETKGVSSWLSLSKVSSFPHWVRLLDLFHLKCPLRVCFFSLLSIGLKTIEITMN